MGTLSFLDGSEPLGMYFQGIYDASTASSAQVGLGEFRTADTVVSDAVQAQTPITPSTGSSPMSGFWAGLNGALSTITNTEVARYQARRLASGTAAPSEDTQSQAPSTVTGKQSKALSPAVLAGGAALLAIVAYLVLRK